MYRIYVSPIGFSSLVPVESRIFTYKVLNIQVPSYLKDLMTLTEYFASHCTFKNPMNHK